MTARVRVLFVDRGGEHADGADEQLAILFCRFLQALDVLFDIAGHFVEVFGQLADFRSAAYRRALMEFTTADGARGCGETADGPADSDCKEVADQDGGEDHDGHESECLAVELVDACVVACLLEAALRDDCPIQLRQRAKRADHLDIAPFDLLRKANGFGAAQLLWQRPDLLDQVGIGGQVRAGNEILRVRMRHDVTGVIDDKHGAPAHAGVLQAAQHRIE